MAARAEVWTIALDAPDLSVERLGAHLDADERRRAEERREPARRRYVVAHGALREIVAGRLGVAPARVRLVARAPHGRPALDHPGAPDVSLTHSGGLALVAVSEGASVGVDVEEVRPRARPADLARRVLSPAEHAVWEQSDDPTTALLRCWTRKEAHLKALGCGITVPLREVDTTRPPAGWTWRDLDPAPGYVGAVALGATDARVVTRTWSAAALRGVGVL